MQEETVVDFKLDVSDESIKRNAVKVVWMFSGVTFVDIKEKGQVKVRGNFDKYEMGTRLQQIDKSVDIINPMQKPEQNHFPFISSISNYFNVQEIVVILEFEVLNERIKPEAMEVIWEYSGITSVEVEENRRLKVKGEEFNKLEMLTKLRKIDVSVKILSVGQVKEDGTKQIKFNMLGNKQPDASSSKGPTQASEFGAAGARAVDKAVEILKVPIKAGFRALYNLRIEKQKADKLRIEKQKAEKLRIEKDKVEKLRKEKEKANKLRIEQEKAEKLRKEKEKANKLRIEQEKAEKLRIQQEKAEKLRIQKEKANKLRSSTFTGTASTYLSTLWNPSPSTQSTQSTRTTAGSTQYQY